MLKDFNQEFSVVLVACKRRTSFYNDPVAQARRNHLVRRERQ